MKKILQFDIITLFPNVFEDYFNASIIKKAKERGLVEIKVHNLRNWGIGKHKVVDDKVYGGGPGMILRADVIYNALADLKIKEKKSKVILLSAGGKQFNQKMAYSYSKLERIILICGHYEGVDARVEKFVDEKISIGPYVLTGGELPAMVIVDAVVRLIKGVIRPESLKEESFSLSLNLIEYPQYTRPAVLIIKDRFGKEKILKVPKVLISGNHQKIKEWRIKKMKIKF